MKNIIPFNKDKTILFYKEKNKKETTLKLKTPYLLKLFFEDKQYCYNILNKDMKIIKKGKGTNYIVLSEEIYVFIKRKKILPEKDILANNLTNSIDSSKDTFNFESIINEGKSNELERIDRNILSSEIKRIKIRGDKMIVETTKENIEGKYNRGDVITVIISYVKELIKEKKQNKTFLIKGLVNLITKEGEVQRLNIIEKDENVQIKNKDTEGEENRGFVSKDLINNIFTICSLEKLAIDERGLKIWLNKIITKKELLTIKLEK